MPENISERSFFHGEIKEHPEVVNSLPLLAGEVHTKVADHLQRYGLEAVSKQINQLQADIKIRYSEEEYPPEKLELMFDLVFGFLRLKPNVLKDVTSNLSIEKSQKELSARVSHSLAHHIIDAGYNDSDESFVSTMYALQRNGLQMSNFIENSVQTQLPYIWAGVRNEVAAIRTLSEKGWQVYMPDYAQDVKKGVVNEVLREEDNEVLQWDVNEGVDLAVVSPYGEIFLMDVKGKKMVDTVRKGLSAEIGAANNSRCRFSGSTNLCLRRGIAEIAERNGLIESEDTDNLEVLNSLKVIRTTLYVPTEGSNFLVVNPHLSLDVDGKRKALQAYGVLKEDVRHEILDSLDDVAENYDSLRPSVLR